jgi:hypothetical protein
MRQHRSKALIWWCGLLILLSTLLLYVLFSIAFFLKEKLDVIEEPIVGSVFICATPEGSEGIFVEDA